MLRYKDFFELLDQENPIAALFMTYGFDAELFERHILPAFLGILDDPKENEMRFRNQIALRLREIPVAVLSDGRQYNGGRTFLYDHVIITKEIFHPKCYILVFKDFLRVIISSANLTGAGLCYNAETIWYEDIYYEKMSTISTDISEVLKWILSHNDTHNIEAVNEIIKYLSNIKGIKGFPKVISTMKEKDVFFQFQNEIKNNLGICKSVTIITPFFENDREKAIENSLLISFYEEILKINPKVKLNLYFTAIYDNVNNYYNVNAPINIFHGLLNKYKDINLYVMPRDWEREEGEDHIPRNLHAKLLIAQFDTGQQLRLSGSVNFTNNAMRSNLKSLRNIEIGILEYTKEKFNLPECIKVDVNRLKFFERAVTQNQIIYFVESAVFDGVNLIIRVKLEKIVLPFDIIYEGHMIKHIAEGIKEITFKNFKLKKSQDIRIKCDDFTFYLPIMIPDKKDVVTDDEKLDFNIYSRDIIDYLAGRYKSISELGKLKSSRNIGAGIVAEDILFFRQNLQRYFKAMAALKQGLELPYYSEQSFRNYIYNPIGIKKLVDLIVEDYKNQKSSDVEAFLFLIELLNVTDNLIFTEDRVDKNFKVSLLDEIMKEARALVSELLKSAKREMKKQYQIMVTNYGLEVY